MDYKNRDYFDQVRNSSGDENIMIMNTDQISDTQESEYRLTDLRVQASRHSPSTGSFAHIRNNYTESQSSKNDFIHVEPDLERNVTSSQSLISDTSGERPNIRIICRIKPNKSESQVQYNVPRFSRSNTRFQDSQRSFGSEKTSPLYNVRKNSRAGSRDSLADIRLTQITPTALSNSARKGSASSNRKPLYSKMLKQDAQYCVFTTRETSRYVFACDNPYSGKLLNESFNRIDDVQFLQNQPIQFKYDGVHDETSQGKQEKVYTQNIRPIIHSFVEGKNGCIFLFGPTNCGKTYTLKGGQGSERGILPRAVDGTLELLQTFGNQKKVFMKISVYMIFKEHVYDLLNKTNSSKPQLEHFIDNDSNSVVSRLTNLSERLVLCTEDFYNVMADAYKQRKEISLTSDRDLRKKSHFIVSLTLAQQKQERKFVHISQLNFVELSGSEQAVQQTNNRFVNLKEMPIHEFVSKSFNSLSCHLMRLVSKKHGQMSEDSESKLVSCLRSSLGPDHNILILNCVSPSQQMFEHSLPSLKFCASMRDQIQKKLRKYFGPSLSQRKKKQVSGSKIDIRSLLISQIKSSEKMMDKIKIQLVDLSPEEMQRKCDNFFDELHGHIQDFDTLIQCAEKQNEGIEMLDLAFKTKDRIIQLIQKIDNKSQSPSPAKHQRNMPLQPIQPYQNLKEQEAYQTMQTTQSVNTFRKDNSSKENSLDRTETLNPLLNPFSQQPPDGLHQFNTVDNRSMPQQQQNRQNFNTFDNRQQVHSVRNSLDAQSQFTEATQRPIVLRNGHVKKNAHQTAESKFTKIKNEVPLPQQLAVSDLRTIEQIVQSLPEVQNSGFTGSQLTAPLYNNESDLVNDISRLMVLQDLDGLKMRVLQLFRDREKIITSAQTFNYKFQQADQLRQAQQILLNEQAQVIQQNSDEVSRYMNEMSQRYVQVELEIVDEIRSQQIQLKSQAERITHLEENLESVTQEKDLAVKERQDEHKLRLEQDKQMREIQAENQKHKQNYDIIKEHEMSIIRDCERRKIEEVQQFKDSIQKEQVQHLEAKKKIEVLQKDLNEMFQNNNNLENDIKLHENEREQMRAKIEQLNADIVVLNQDVSKHKSKQVEDVELIQIMRKQADGIRQERDEKQREIQKLKNDLRNNEKSVDNQHQMFLRVQGEVKQLQKDLEQLRSDKHGLKDQLQKEKHKHSLEIAEKDILIQAHKDQISDMQNQSEVQKTMIASKDQELLHVKAQEYDKVDMIKKVAELEATIRKIEDEKKDLVRDKNEIERNFKELSEENNQLVVEIEKQRNEIQQIKVSHEGNLDKFDQKFENVTTQMDRFKSENHMLKSQVQTMKDRIQDQEKEKVHWRDKCRQAERKGEEINLKIVELETELRNIIYDKHQQQELRVQQEKIQGQKQVFGDIQYMINQYRESKSRVPERNLRISDNISNQLSEPVVMSARNELQVPMSQSVADNLQSFKPSPQSTMQQTLQPQRDQKRTMTVDYTQSLDSQD